MSNSPYSIAMKNGRVSYWATGITNDGFPRGGTLEVKHINHGNSFAVVFGCYDSEKDVSVYCTPDTQEIRITGSCAPEAIKAILGATRDLDQLSIRKSNHNSGNRTIIPLELWKIIDQIEDPKLTPYFPRREITCFPYAEDHDSGKDLGFLKLVAKELDVLDDAAKEGFGIIGRDSRVKKVRGFDIARTVAKGLKLFLSSDGRDEFHGIRCYSDSGDGVIELDAPAQERLQQFLESEYFL